MKLFGVPVVSLNNQVHVVEHIKFSALQDLGDSARVLNKYPKISPIADPSPLAFVGLILEDKGISHSQSVNSPSRQTLLH